MEGAGPVATGKLSKRRVVSVVRAVVGLIGAGSSSLESCAVKKVVHPCSLGDSCLGSRETSGEDWYCAALAVAFIQFAAAWNTEMPAVA